MGVLDLFTGGGDSAIGAITNLVSTVLDRVIPDPVAREAAKERLLALQQKGELAQLAASTDIAKGQLEINKAEAASGNWFVAGWRPAIGWVCAFIMANNYVFAPYIDFIARIFHSQISVPVLDYQGIAPILIAMLGGGQMILRTMEKWKGVQGNH